MKLLNPYHSTIVISEVAYEPTYGSNDSTCTASIKKHWLNLKHGFSKRGRGGKSAFLCGNEFAFRGVYHEVRAPERMIDTFEFEGLPEAGHVCLETLTFEASPAGRTRLTAHAVFQSVADRDGALQSGMEEGVTDSHERLADLLETLSH